MMRWRLVGFVAALGLCLHGLPVAAEPAYVSVVREFVEKRVKPVILVPLVRKAIEDQNAKFGDISEMDVRVLDNTYRSEIQNGEWQMVKRLLEKPVSRYLKSKQDDSQGAIVEIFVTDRHGLNVGQSVPTTDYWQGDEDKFLKTFAKGTDTTFIDRAERDDTTQLLETQASFVIHDEIGRAIGIATVTIAIDAL
ncbi:hypothetical protein FZ934_05300 [Rhizobium grahamii]|uniref:Uncharacterized protein n=1 Tax=Rhizobium grahamii TaxID=1120045 RepID=A0A5Q0C7F0_9HYPH|nr:MULTISPECIES: hypothetical protein [Rhizobium]QFY59900.1 hypothetical protein FZ934_05300 [Rhizobium grahamii]QRM50982.1 hypothetical protein F3Y33_17590 [Rhizobium sp. BG6]